MLLKIEEKYVKTARYFKTGLKVTIAICKCDVCGVEFELTPKHAKKCKIHVHSKECDAKSRLKDGVMYNHLKSVIKEKYGVDWSSQIDAVKQKVKETNVEKYGVEVSSKNELVKQKARETCIKRYGGNSPMSSKEIIEKAKQTSIQKFGGNGGPFNDYDIRKKFNQTMQDRYGVDWSSQSPEILAKQHITNLQRYGKKFVIHTFESIKKHIHLNLKLKDTKQKNKMDIIFLLN